MAVISDIHGNITALDTVLKEIRQRNIPRIVCLGDLIGKGPASCRVIDICREESSVVIKGNWDDVATRAHIESDFVRWFADQVDDERKMDLSSLPLCYNLMLGNKRIRFFHASQESPLI
ncbi:MAG: metallophosphoesterase [Spirochaetales bacterium]|nr:metallophosphoesterase [Spirochaetales bacterium]